MEIKSIEQIKDEYAGEQGRDSWEEFFRWNELIHSSPAIMQGFHDEIATRYAQQFQEQHPTDVLTTEIMVLRERNVELAVWKESAMQVMNDLNLQAIGDELGFKLGSSIAPQVLSAIKKMKNLNAEMLEMLESRLIVLENCGMKSPNALIELITKAKEVCGKEIKP